MKLRLFAAWAPDHRSHEGMVFLDQSIERDWPELPARGDTVMLPDGSGGQDVTVEERVFNIDGSVALWVGGFDGWDLEGVKALGFTEARP